MSKSGGATLQQNDCMGIIDNLHKHAVQLDLWVHKGIEPI